jgi:hypothetical protein
MDANPGQPQLRRNLGGSFNNMGDLQLSLGKAAEAIGSYRRAHELIGPLVKAHPEVAQYEFGLAFSLAGLGRANIKLG